MSSAKWLYLLSAAVLAVGSPWTASAGEKASGEKAAGEKASGEKAAGTSQAENVDEDWLNTVWTQVDEMVKEKEFKLQETVTVAGVRGAEAEDNILDKLYYKGGKRYPSQDKLKKAIDTLEKSIAKNPKDKTVPKQKYFIAQCYEKLGKVGKAREYYTQVTKEYPKTPWASKAQKRLAQLAAPK